ncbi:molecular chaperone TorD [Psychrobacter urativorans]|uniref:molecular chaperone TorD n=1 Tax=Psychrobacter urativorans TaxID=45610 RepID=UPI001918B2BB|nr:molecular chaperone TorD [Psychrobacter urativorans]
MNITEEWQAANTARSALYRWFADIFARELTSDTLDGWQHNQAYDSIHEAFTSLGLEQYSDRVKVAIDNLKELPKDDRAIELAADFAQLFLLSGDDSAPPYASYYLSNNKHLYGKPAEHMLRFLDSQQLSLHPEFREPNDHLSVYFIVMSLWINNSIEQQLEMVSTAQEQIDFLDSALLNWLPQFTTHCQKIRVKTDLYPALTALAEQFILEDREALATIVN